MLIMATKRLSGEEALLKTEKRPGKTLTRKRLGNESRLSVKSGVGMLYRYGKTVITKAMYDNQDPLHTFTLCVSDTRKEKLLQLN